MPPSISICQYAQEKVVSESDLAMVRGLFLCLEAQKFCKFLKPQQHINISY